MRTKVQSIFMQIQRVNRTPAANKFIHGKKHTKSTSTKCRATQPIHQCRRVSFAVDMKTKWKLKSETALQLD